MEMINGITNFGIVFLYIVGIFLLYFVTFYFFIIFSKIQINRRAIGMSYFWASHKIEEIYDFWERFACFVAVFLAIAFIVLGGVLYPYAIPFIKGFFG